MSKRKSIAWILDFTSKLPDDEEKIKCLRANDHPSIKIILRNCFHPDAHWLLPEGEPPYTQNPEADENALYAEAKKLYLFVQGGADHLTDTKRQQLFINVLQNVQADDAELLMSLKDKVMPYPGLTAEVVKKAFPEIF